MKSTSIFFCKECGYETPKWLGQCPSCKNWNTLVEEPTAPKSSGKGRKLSAAESREKRIPVRLREISTEEEPRFSSGILEMDRVLGGGIVPASLVLIGGDPGIGKSTILLQMCRNLVSAGKKVLYISGEESKRQIKMRADRMGEFEEGLYLLCETNLDTISEAIREQKPDLVVIDSIQTMFREDISSAPGSVGQVRECTNQLLQLAKGEGIATFLVGHVTKEGMVAGPRVLEHMVDTVLYFEGDRSASYRILRAVKNRFGSTNEIGVFEMQSTGLREVENPSAYLLQGRPEHASGSVVSCSVEGTRPILMEVQALVCRTNFGMPRRTAVGTDYNRVNLLMAVLEKRLHLSLGQCDAYVNVTGGMRVSEPSMDLAIVIALISSYLDIEVDEHTMAFGEVGISGEVRSVSQCAKRLQEASKLGFSTCIAPQVALEGLDIPKGMNCVGVKNLSEVLQYLKKEKK